MATIDECFKNRIYNETRRYYVVNCTICGKDVRDKDTTKRGHLQGKHKDKLAEIEEPAPPPMSHPVYNLAVNKNASFSGDKELEELKEKNHILHLKIETLKQNHATEVDYLKYEIQVKVTEAKSHEERLKAEWRLKEKDLVERNSSLVEEIHQLRDSSHVQKGQMEQLQRTLDHYKTVQVDRNCRTEQYETLRKNLRQILEAQQSRVHELTQPSERQKEVVNELREEMESKDQCISQLQTRMREVEAEHQDEIMILQQNIMMQHRVDEEVIDPSKRGNSLFSELEERRARVEEELTRLRERVARLTSENVELKSQIERSSDAIIVTLSQLIQNSETGFIQELKQLRTETMQMYETYMDRFHALRNEYKRKLVLHCDGVDNPQVEEIETLRQDRDQLLSQNMAIRRELQDIKKDLEHSILQRTEADANIEIYRVKLQAVQEQQRKPDHDSKPKLDRSRNSAENSTSPPSRTSSEGSKSNGNSADTEKWLYKNVMAESEQR